MPTPEELEFQFQQNKNSKIALSKSMLADFLENNPIHSSAHGNVEGVYSATSEKQTLMMSQYMTYQIEKTVNPEAKLTWNETGKACEEWTENEFLQLILEIKAYVYPLVSYQQRIEESISECVTQEELDKIVINYNSIVAKTNYNFYGECSIFHFDTMFPIFYNFFIPLEIYFKNIFFYFLISNFWKIAI